MSSAHDQPLADRTARDRTAQAGAARTEPPAPDGRWPRWLPNAISVLRIVLVPVFVLIAAECQRNGRVGDDVSVLRTGALVTLGSIGLSDVIDGYLAGRHGLARAFGAMLDAVADKLAQVGLLVFFTFSRGPSFEQVPLWFLAVILGRDLLLAAGWFAVRRRRGAVDAEHHVHGKTASVLVFLLLALITAGQGPRVLQPLFVLTAALVTLSTAAYVRHGVRQYSHGTPQS